MQQKDPTGGGIKIYLILLREGVYITSRLQTWLQSKHQLHTMVQIWIIFGMHMQ